MTYTPTAPPVNSSPPPNASRRERRVAEAYMGKCTTHVTHIALFIIGFSALVFGLWKEREIGKLKEKLEELEDRFDLAQINELGRNLELTPSTSYRRYNNVASGADDDSDSKEDGVRRYKVEASMDYGPFHSSALVKRRKRDVPVHVVQGRQAKRNGRRIGMLRRMLARSGAVNQQQRQRRMSRRKESQRTDRPLADSPSWAATRPQQKTDQERGGSNHRTKQPKSTKSPQSYPDMFPSFHPLMPPTEALNKDALKAVKSKLNPKNAMKFSIDTMKNPSTSKLFKKRKHHHHSKHKHKSHSTNKYTLDPLNLFGYQHSVTAAHYEATNVTKNATDNIIRHWKQADWMDSNPNSTIVMNNGVVSVRKPALYFLYSQIQLATGASTSDGISIEVNNRTVASCSANPINGRTSTASSSCFTATTKFLHKGDDVYVQQFKDSPLSNAPDSTFLGLVHLGVPNSVS